MANQVSGFIKNLWESEIQMEFSRMSIAHLLAHDIPVVGGKYVLNRFKNVTVKDYAGEVVYDDVQLTPKEITLDERKYWAVHLDDIQEAQVVKPLRATVVASAGEQIAMEIDKFVVGELMKTTNKQEIPHAKLETVSFYDELVKAQSRMNKRNVPHQGRICAVSQEVLDNMMLDQRFIAYFRNATILENGMIDGVVVNGVQFVVSNAVPDNTMILVHQPTCYGFATLLEKTEVLRDKDSFQDLLRGLIACGGGFTREESVEVVTVLAE